MGGESSEKRRILKKGKLKKIFIPLQTMSVRRKISRYHAI
jgi:hypothetical protein